MIARQAMPDDWVLVHDAARPCVSAGQVCELVRCVQTSGHAGILAQPIVDTVKQASSNGEVRQTLDRNNLWRAQTPQMFRLSQLREALIAAIASGDAVTDEASAMELAGHAVKLYHGSASNLKVTVPEDLRLAEFYLQREGSKL